MTRKRLEILFVDVLKEKEEKLGRGFDVTTKSRWKSSHCFRWHSNVSNHATPIYPASFPPTPHLHSKNRAPLFVYSSKTQHVPIPNHENSAPSHPLGQQTNDAWNKRKDATAFVFYPCWACKHVRNLDLTEKIKIVVAWIFVSVSQIFLLNGLDMEAFTIRWNLRRDTFFYGF